MLLRSTSDETYSSAGFFCLACLFAVITQQLKTETFRISLGGRCTFCISEVKGPSGAYKNMTPNKEKKTSSQWQKHILHLNLWLWLRAMGNFIYSVAFWHGALLLFPSADSFTLCFSTWKTSFEVPINKAPLQKKRKRKSIVMLCELHNGQQEQTAAADVMYDCHPGNKGEIDGHLMFKV